ncbi:hypothetical protein BV22DRAFT_1003622 [Leucogyrophana mollusca]|uniref:Uncharacterized protein n=1 Tax=Leucogyrophana mollusca TaxID=85980 RepID=A0ACB8BV36_9AGAM|nr:hypothetical protein BV22DRAFT_1003622 [Leucogyrophana mollusca]
MDDLADTDSKHSEPWADDGNLILIAEGEEFRVHRSILCSYSQIFKDMFHSSSAEELVDDCPIVHLSDTVDDVRHVLKALYDRSYCVAGSPQLPLDVIGAFLRLGKKYEISCLYLEAKDRLVGDFPSTLENHDQIATLGCRIEGFNSAIIFRVINLAREGDVQIILPAAMRHCSLFVPPEDILISPRNSSTSLTDADRQACVIAASILQTMTATTYSWLDPKTPTSPYCQGHKKCSQSKQALLATLWFPSAQKDPHAPWNAEWEKGLCTDCARNAKASHNTKRKEAWQALPSVFKLPEWDELLSRCQ